MAAWDGKTFLHSKTGCPRCGSENLDCHGCAHPDTHVHIVCRDCTWDWTRYDRSLDAMRAEFEQKKGQ